MASYASRLADAVMEEMNCDGIRIEGANPKELKQPVSLAQLLIRCHLTPTKAKGAVERLRETGSTALELPSAPADIVERLAASNVEAFKREAQPVDVATIRLGLGMTLEESTS